MNRSSGSVKTADVPEPVFKELTVTEQEVEDDRLEDSEPSEVGLDVAKKKKKKTRFITKSMAEDFSREQVLFSSLIETIFYIIYVIICTLYVTHLKSSSMFYMINALKESMINRNFKTVNDIDINFNDIKTVADIWEFSKTLLIQAFYYDEEFDKYLDQTMEEGNAVVYENFLLGVPRLRQVRVRNNSCVIHSFFKRMFKTCYDKFDKYSEETESFGPEEPTAWVYSSEKVTQSIPYTGVISTYSGGGYYKDLDADGNRTIDIIHYLMDNLWISRHTRAVFVDFSLYNVNLNIFSVCKLVFELPPTGGVISKAKFQPLRLVMGDQFLDHVALICEYIFYIYSLFYIFQSIREIVYFQWKYFIKFWSYVDCLISGLAVCALGYSMYVKSHIATSVQQITKNTNKYGNLEQVGSLQATHNDLCAIMIFLIYVRLFKYLNFNKTMAQLNDTLTKCAFDVMGFSIMFFIIFFAYAELGYLVFGSQVDDFRTFAVSMFSLLRTILGDFDYADIEHAHRILAPIYFLSYIFFVFFVLLNMFLAIINDTYADVKTEIAIAPSELQMFDFMKIQLNKCLRKCGFKIKETTEKKTEYNVTAEEIRRALKKCGFSYLEIEMFFTRFNIDPMASVNEYDIKKLMAELEKSQPQAGDQEETKENRAQLKELAEHKRLLKQLEMAVFKLAKRVDELMKKLEELGATINED